VAGKGRLGLDTEDPWDGNMFTALTALCAIGEDELDEDEIDEIEGKLAERMRSLTGRLVDPLGDSIHLTSEEWGRRLAGKSAEEIALALRGTGDY
jgi:hypothetical protein